MPALLTRLKITEVSSVDRGAGKGVKVMLIKRDPDAGDHIGESPMKQFGQVMMVDTFKQLLQAAVDNGAEDMDRLRKVASALKESAADIRKLDEGDRPEAFTDTIEQCVKHLATIVPAGSVDAFNAAVAAIPAVAKGSKAMTKTLTLEELTASMDKLTKRNAVLEALVKARKKDTDHATANDMDEDDTQKFLAKSEAERDAIIAKAAAAVVPKPKTEVEKAIAAMLKGSVCKECGGEDGDHMKKCSSFGKSIYTGVLSTLAAVDKRDEVIADLKKRIDVGEAEKETEICKRLCVDHGLTEADAAMLAKLRKLDPAAATAWLTKSKALIAQANPTLFTEIGKSGPGASDNPTVEIYAKAAEIMQGVNKSAKNPGERISIEKARVMAREQNPDLAKRERDVEQRRRLGRAA